MIKKDNDKTIGIISKSLTVVAGENNVSLEDVLTTNAEFMRRSYKRVIDKQNYTTLMYDEGILLDSLEKTKRFYQRYSIAVEGEQ